MVSVSFSIMYSALAATDIINNWLSIPVSIRLPPLYALQQFCQIFFRQFPAVAHSSEQPQYRPFVNILNKLFDLAFSIFLLGQARLIIMGLADSLGLENSLSY
jgi:hypothetical protein